MNLSKAFDRTLERFGITGKSLKDASGVSEQMISGFRNGKQRVWSDSLERMIEALPIEAQQYFFEYLLTSAIERSRPSLEETILEMEPGALASVLSAIAERLSPSPRTSNSTITDRDRVLL